MRKNNYITIDYEHLQCNCGGTIGMFDRNNFTCNQCGKRFALYRLQYDRLMINNQTGWIFPVKNIKEYE